jgi:hypothetical protein
MIDIQLVMDKCSFLHEIENGTELAIAWITQGYAQMKREQQTIDEDRIVDITNRNREEILRGMARDREEILRGMAREIQTMPLHITTQLQDKLRPLEEAHRKGKRHNPASFRLDFIAASV